MPRRALVFGGSGAVGREVVRGLAAAGVEVVFTYRRSEQVAQSLAAELAQQAIAVDLRQPAEVRALVRKLSEAAAPDIFVHCAGVSRDLPLAEINEDAWRESLAVNAEAAFIALQELAPHLERQGGGDVVLVGALDRGQSFEMPVHFAAAQGMQAAMTMALAKALGKAKVRVNQVVLGPLSDGLSRDLSPKLREAYTSFSALRRVGSPAEAAKVITWLALENTYMSGRTVAVNGGV